MEKLKDLKNRFDKSKKINYSNINEILILGKKILKIFLIVMIVAAIYIVVKVCKELNVVYILLTILTILTPFFIGIVIAWLFNPIVNFLEKKGIRRLIGASLSYVILIGLILIIAYSIIPLAYEQLKDLSTTIPTVLKNIENIINNTFDNFKEMNIVDTINLKNKLYGIVSGFTNELSSTLPNNIVNIIKSVISGTGTFLVGLLIGFFLLLGFNNITDSLLIFIPKKFHKDTKELFAKIAKVLRGYVNGALFDAIIIFIACSIAFFIIGVKSPILFALFCGIMNVIPYAGPYIGAIPALIVAYSQSLSIGIGATISIIIIQCLEGNILSPIVMSKNTKLNPVSIIVGLLIFGHFFGIIGMLLSTPIISVLKVVLEFIDKKFNIFSDSDEIEENL